MTLKTLVQCRRCSTTHWGWWHRKWYLHPDDMRGDLCPPCKSEKEE